MNIASAYSQHVKKRAQRIYDQVSKTTGIYSAAYFHQLRVEIKKMNAALRIVKHCSPDFPRKKIFQPYKTIGKSAGEVREIQLEESAIRKLPPDQFTRHYLLMLKEQRLVKKKEFVEVKIQANTSLKKRLDKILPFADDINSVNASVYLNQLKQNCIDQMNKEKLNIATIHKLRMILKEYLYNFEVINSNSKLTLKPLYQLQDLIGKWHDLNVIQHHLNNYKRRSKLSVRNAAHLQKVKSGFSENASLLISRINKLKNEALSLFTLRAAAQEQ